MAMQSHSYIFLSWLSMSNSAFDCMFIDVFVNSVHSDQQIYFLVFLSFITLSFIISLSFFLFAFSILGSWFSEKLSNPFEEQFRPHQCDVGEQRYRSNQSCGCPSTAPLAGWRQKVGHNTKLQSVSGHYRFQMFSKNACKNEKGKCLIQLSPFLDGTVVLGDVVRYLSL